MIIDVARIPYEGREFIGEDPARILDIEDKTLQVTGPIRYRLNVYRAEMDLIIAGQLETDVEFTCSKCAEKFTLRIRENDFKTVRETKDLTDVVDLTEEIRESIILAFPTYPVCSSECRGLCAQCGKNLNERKCRCKPPPGILWSALNDLKIK